MAKFVKCTKVHGAQNDFIIIDNRDNEVSLTKEQRRVMCHRHLGIGADGLMEIHQSDVADYKLSHFNATGASYSLCGNGSRCSVLFYDRLGLPRRKISSAVSSETGSNSSNAARGEVQYRKIEQEIHRLGFADSYYVFEAHDGLHFGGVSSDGKTYFVRFNGVDLSQVKLFENGDFYMKIGGTPHHIRFVKSAKDIDVALEGTKIRHELYKGPNILTNFVSEELSGDNYSESILVSRTYMIPTVRELMACGTGSIAIAIADAIRKLMQNGDQSLERIDIPEVMSSRDKIDTSMGTENSSVANGLSGQHEDANNYDDDDDKKGECRFIVKQVKMPGGTLRVHFVLNKDRVESIWVKGPCVCVMEGSFMF